MVFIVLYKLSLNLTELLTGALSFIQARQLAQMTILMIISSNAYLTTVSRKI